MDMGIDLPLIWAGIIGFGLMMYVIMDGFDLGIGILFPFVQDPGDRDTMVNTVAPVWDGNETWLVLGGAGLLAAFPIAYSVILSAAYLPIIAMLMGLICRGVAFEFRFKADEAHKPIWDRAFTGGSYVATFSQGVILGSFINGFSVTNGAYSGGPLDWLTPFGIFSGFGLIIAYALLGTTWLILKTESDLQTRMRSLARPICSRRSLSSASGRHSRTRKSRRAGSRSPTSCFSHPFRSWSSSRPSRSFGRSAAIRTRFRSFSR